MNALCGFSPHRNVPNNLVEFLAYGSIWSFLTFLVFGRAIFAVYFFVITNQVKYAIIIYFSSCVLFNPAVFMCHYNFAIEASYYRSTAFHLDRNGTPRQPLLVPLASACLVFDLARVPPASLEGLGEYSHCWIIYVFHLNTDLEKLWKHPSKSKFKAKVCAL